MSGPLEGPLLTAEGPLLTAKGPKTGAIFTQQVNHKALLCIYIYITCIGLF